MTHETHGEDAVEVEFPPWVLIQKKSFSKLVNKSFINPSDMVVDLFEDFRDGKKLLIFLSCVLETDVPSPEKGHMRVHHINNVNKAINVMKTNQVKLFGVGAEEIVDGNPKMTLGMTWAIILRRFIESIKEGSCTARDGLLLWCQKKTEGYKDVKIKEFSHSWKDGLGFCALIHAHRSDLIPYDTLSVSNPAENLELAFDVAHKHFGITPILEVEDMIGSDVPDEKSVMAYVSLYHEAFSKFNSKEQAAKRLLKILDINEGNSRLMDSYEKSCSDLHKWMNEKMPWLTDRCGNSPTIEDIRQKYDEFHKYRQGEKPPRADEKARLESDYQSIQTKLNLQNRPQYIPPDNMNPKFIDDTWKVLEQEERNLLDWLDSMLKMMAKLEYLVNRFYYKCSKQEEWMTGIAGEFVIDSLRIDTGLSELIGTGKRFQTSESDFKSRETRIAHITSLRDQLESLKYSKMPDIQARFDSVMVRWTELQQTSKDYNVELQKLILQAQKLDEIRVEYSNSASSFRNWLEECLEDYGEDYKPRDVSEIEEWMKSHSTFMKNMPQSLSEYDHLNDLTVQAQAFTHQPNQYCSITLEQLETRISNLKKSCDERSKMLDEEHEKIKVSGAVHEKFNSRVNEMDAWRTQFSERVSQVVMDRNGTLEFRKGLMKAFLIEVDTYYSEKMQLLDSLNEEMRSNNVYHWENSAEAAIFVRSSFERSIRMINSAISEIDNQIAIQESSGLSTKEIDEIKKSFNTFAKEDPSALNHQEFLNCLISLGFDLGVTIENNEKFKKILSIVDPVHSAKIPMSSLLTYVTSQRKDDAASADDIVESFRLMADGKLFILPDEIKKNMPPKYADQCISLMRPSSESSAPVGALDYHSYAENLYGESEV